MGLLRLGITAVVLLPLLLGSCRRAQPLTAAPEPSPRQKLIRDIQEFGRASGFEQTGTFSRTAPGRQAFYRCYYTEKLRLPDSYEGLKVKEGTAQGCDIDERRYDVFFYVIEAVASPSTPVTEALAGASLERLAVVVSHEEFHQQKPIRRLPATVEEASATLISFLTAAGYARAAQGEDSRLFRNLSGEAETFLNKAEAINLFHGKLKSLYQSAAAGRISKAAALSEKQRLFERLRQACTAITPDPASFNECPAAMNNAGLAFDHTYSKHYALMYRLALVHGKDLPSLVATLKSLPAARKWTEQEAVAYLESWIESRPAIPAG
jgi:hypothetical protein